MPEPARCLPGFGQQWAQRHLTAQDVLLIRGQPDRVQIDMAVGVVAQFETGIAPVAQHLYARGLHPSIHLEFDLVDEPHHRHVRLLQGCDQLCMTGGKLGLGAFVQTLPGQIIDRQRDAPLRLGRVRDTGQAQQRQHPPSKESLAHPLLPSRYPAPA